MYVGPSTVLNAGHGVFARKPIKKGTVFSFYNGIKISFLESKVKGEDRKSQYALDNDWNVPQQIIDIPPRYRY